jgi:hypothetical protein
MNKDKDAKKGVVVTLVQCVKDCLPSRVSRALVDDVPLETFLVESVLANSPLLFVDLQRESWTLAGSAEGLDLVRESAEAVKRIVLASLAPEALVCVNVTPSGLADAVVDGCFYLPHEEQMPVGELLTALALETEESYAEEKVSYASQQNDCLRTEEWRALLDRCPSFPLFDRAFCSTSQFDSQADARNIWIGNASSTTTLHQDHYENALSVVCGVKTVKLLPPSAQPLLVAIGSMAKFPTRQWRMARSAQGPVEWDADPVYQQQLDADEEGADEEEGKRAPLLQQWVSECWEAELLAATGIAPLVVCVGPGETLYLPAMWLHEVTQNNHTLGLNSWYNMDFGSRYHQLRALEALAAQAASVF